MNAREELAAIIWDRTDCRDEETPDIAADFILAAGYRKPRTITTAEERASLAPGTVAVDEFGNAWKRGTGSWVGTGEMGPLFDYEDITLTVLYTSEES